MEQAQQDILNEIKEKAEKAEPGEDITIVSLVPLHSQLDLVVMLEERGHSVDDESFPFRHIHLKRVSKEYVPSRIVELAPGIITTSTFDGCITFYIDCGKGMIMEVVEIPEMLFVESVAELTKTPDANPEDIKRETYANIRFIIETGAYVQKR